MAEVYLLPLVVTLAGFAALWPVSLWRRDASVVDLWWAPGFLVQTGLAIWLAGGTGAAGWLMLALVAAWAVRMAWVLIGRRLRAHEEDPRYTAIRLAWGPSFWWKSLGIVFLLQGALQWLMALGPIGAVVAAGPDLGLFAWAGAAVALAGLVVETRADAELDRFKRSAPPGALCDQGLRAWVRHPNYAGEIAFWLGIGLVALSAGSWLGLLPPLLIGVLLTQVSGAPMLDEHMTATRPGYAAYRARVPGFLPRLR